ncbi:tRNA pseudouridine synthase A [Candidatus Endolissoclinum faulkneri L5]|uniref:tRNA pseudouridine synthase A n=1 Tax=Candidatus Endolissoclinum faulkneri L5 TaxID=1401328 RepID=V9TUS8_9PROT|nr:tRNA pseudouridine(38-40) synthase TruA [Candidatus Endolissoclinum faulkneri]AHC73448.1 tRNA pseudouridine synthase A [Candidatus Endolissoclinum faulkneri L5]
MPRFKLKIEYDGRPYIGWQRQLYGPTIQNFLENAVFNFSGERVEVAGAGRTDRGVHATGQVAHVQLANHKFDAQRIMKAINALISPEPIVVVEAEEVKESFHARFSAVERCYRYEILNRRAPTALYRGLAWHVKTPLFLDAMQEAAQRLVGHHDFTSFRSRQCQSRSAEKTLDQLDIFRESENRISIIARSRSFLHHQMRNIVGTLALVGIGKWTSCKVSDVLAARQRSAAGPTAPAGGLYLTSVKYPDEH